MAVSASALIPRVRDLIGDQPWATQGSAASSSSVVAVTDGTDWEEGAIGEFQDTGEQFKVISVSTNDLTCFRGWNGTTGAIHAASTTIVRDPKVSYRQIDEALDHAVRRLWPYVWKQESVTVTPNTTTRWFNLTATCMALIDAVQLYGASSEYEGVYGERGGYDYDIDISRKNIILRRDMPTGLVASGVGARFPDGFFHVSNNITLHAAARITGTSDIEDSETLPVGDAVVIGALAQLMKGLQFQRLINVDGRDQATQIASGARLQHFGALEAEFRDRLQQLNMMCQELYPIETDSGW